MTNAETTEQLKDYIEVKKGSKGACSSAGRSSIIAEKIDGFNKRGRFSDSRENE